MNAEPKATFIKRIGTDTIWDVVLEGETFTVRFAHSDSFLNNRGRAIAEAYAQLSANSGKAERFLQIRWFDGFGGRPDYSKKTFASYNEAEAAADRALEEGGCDTAYDIVFADTHRKAKRV